VCIY